MTMSVTEFHKYFQITPTNKPIDNSTTIDSDDEVYLDLFPD